MTAHSRPAAPAAHTEAIAQTAASGAIAGADCAPAVAEAKALREVSEQPLNLHEIGLALSSERDIEALLGLILTKARELTDNERWAPGQEAIVRLSKRKFHGQNGPQVLVDEEEAAALSVRRASLTMGERRQMETHATMSFDFLGQIAWPPHLSRIPMLAHLHHEKLDGSGYPRGVHGADIPLLGRMMTVTDIFDALVAADRPYKRTMPLERALAILHDEVARGLLDADVVALFVRRRLWEAA